MVSDGAACRRCAAGKQPDNLTACADCQLGHVSDGSVCSACPDGSQPDRGSAMCVACSRSHSSANTQHVCAACPSGKEPNAAKSACIDCAPGRFSNSSHGTCESCSLGQVADISRTRCAYCPGLDEVSSDGRRCEQCRRGWTASEQRDYCVPCSMSGFLDFVASGVCSERFGSASLPLAGAAACAVCTNSTTAFTVSEERNYCRECHVGFERTDTGCSRCDGNSISQVHFQ